MTRDFVDLVTSLEKSGCIILTISQEDIISQVTPTYGALNGQSFYSLFPTTDHHRARGLLKKARSQSDISVLFRGPLESFDDIPMAMLMGPMENNNVGDLFCMLVNWRGESEQFLVKDEANTASAVRSMHRLSNQVAAMRLNAELADLNIQKNSANKYGNQDELHHAVNNIVSIAQIIEQDIMQLAPYLNYPAAIATSSNQFIDQKNGSNE